jgi:hypothetical protein
MTRPDQPVIAQRPSANGSAKGDTASTGELVSRLTGELSRLVHAELQLLRVDATRAAKRAGMGAGAFGAAGVLAWFGVAGLLTAAILGLATVLDPWFAALIVGVAVMVGAALAALIGRTLLRRSKLPDEITDNLRADVRTVKEHAKR